MAVLRRLFLFGFAAALWAGDRPESNVKPLPAFFSGLVDSFDPSRITVRRTNLGSRGDLRSFAVTPETRVEGRIRPKSRVTVRFVESEESDDLALSIVVRDPQK